MAEIEVGRVTIRVEPDTRGFKRELTQEVREAARGAEKNVNMGADFDGSNVKPEAAAVAKDAKQKVKFEAETDGFKQVQLMARETLRIQNRTGNLSRIAQNAHLLRQEKEKVHLANTLNAIRANDPTLATVKKLQVYQRETFKIQKRTAAVQAKAQRSRAKSDKAAIVASGAILASAGSAKSIGEQLAPSFGSGVNLPAVALILAGITAYAAPLLGFITTAVLALPGLIGLIAAPIAALALGMDGLKFAAKQIEVPLNNLKVAISAKTADVFTPIFKKMVPVLKEMREPIAHIVEGVGEAANKMVDFVASGEGMRRMQSMTDSIGQFFKDGDFGFESLLDATTGLGEEFTKNLPDMSKWFNETMLQFRMWVNEISADGTLQGAFSNLGTVIDSLVQNIGRIGAAAVKAFGKPEGADLLTETFDLIASIMVRIIAMSETISRNLQNIAQVIRPIVAGILAAMGQYSASQSIIQDFLTNAPLFEPTVDMRGTHTVMQDWHEEVLELAGSAKDAVESVGESTSVTPGALLDAATGTTKEDGEPTELPVPDTTAASAELAKYDTFVDTVSAHVRGSLQKATTGQDLAPPNFEAFNAAWTGMARTVETAVAQMTEAPTRLQGMSSIITSSFSTIGATTITAFGEMVGAVKSGTNEAVGIMEGLPPRMLAPMQGLRSQMVSQGVAIGEGLAEGISLSTGKAVDAARRMAAAVTAASATVNEIKSPSGVTEEQGREIVNGLALGIAGQAYIAQQVAANSLSLSQGTKDKINESYKDLGVAGINPGDTLSRLESTPFTAEQANRLKEISKDYKELNRTLRFLRADLEASNDAGDVAIQAEIDHIKAIKERIKVEKDALSLHKEAQGVAEKDEGKGPEDYLNSAIGAGTSFAMANADQFASDLGISGNGALSQGLDQGISFLSSSLSKMISGGFGGSGGNIVVNNVDDAMAAHQNQTNIQKKRYVNR